MKRIFTFFFVLLSACTFSAYAAIVDGTCGDNLTWTLNSKDSTLVIAGTGKMTNYSYSSSAPWSDYASYIKYVTLPDGLTSIGDHAFRVCSALNSITIPNSVTSIGESAFGSCSSLTFVTLGNSVTSIGEWAFYYCESLTSITIPNSVTSIGDRAFMHCKGLTSVTLGNSVTSIGEWAFYWCESLTSITIPNSVTSIGDYAFRVCDGLTSVALGKNLKSIGDNAFGSCDQIRVVTAYMPTPPVVASCGINPAAATLYVPEEYVGIYSNTIWWEDFKEIRAIDPNLVGGNKDLTLVFKDQDNTPISTQSITVMFPPAPVIEGFTFLYWKTIDARVDNVITLQAVYESNTPSAAPEVFVNPTNPAQKLIRNGQVYILQEDKMYTISGQVVK